MFTRSGYYASHRMYTSQRVLGISLLNNGLCVLCNPISMFGNVRNERHIEVHDKGNRGVYIPCISIHQRRNMIAEIYVLVMNELCGSYKHQCIGKY